MGVSLGQGGPLDKGGVQSLNIMPFFVINIPYFFNSFISSVLKGKHLHQIYFKKIYTGSLKNAFRMTTKYSRYPLQKKKEFVIYSTAPNLQKKTNKKDFSGKHPKRATS